MVKKTPRFVYSNAYNASSGLLRNRVTPFPYNNNYSDKLIPLKKWCDENFFTQSQGYRFIKNKTLLALKMGGKWYVRLNPNCTLEDLTHESC